MKRRLLMIVFLTLLFTPVTAVFPSRIGIDQHQIWGADFNYVMTRMAYHGIHPKLHRKMVMFTRHKLKGWMFLNEKKEWCRL